MTTEVKKDNWAKAREVLAAKRAAMAATVSEDEEFAANAEGVNITTEEALNEEMAATGEDVEVVRKRGRSRGQPDTVVVTHTRPDMRTLYKRTPNGYAAIAVSSSNVATLLREGKVDGSWRSSCGDCGGHHPDGPNDCPGRDPIAFRICPVCGTYRAWDNYQIDSTAALLAELEAKDEPGLIKDKDYAASTPESRTKAALDRHLWIRHRGEAEAMGIAPLPEPPTTDLENKLNSIPRYGVQAGG